jgi:hypothetical protein
MNSIIYFVEFENRVISATYRNLMIGAKVVIVDKTSGAQLPDPVTAIASPVPNGLLWTSRDGQTGGLLFESVERAWRAGRAKCRVSCQLTPPF